MNRDNFPNLALLLAAYFHQDWMIDHAGEEAVVQFFHDKESVDVVAATKGDIVNLLQQTTAIEFDLGDFLVESLGSSCDPRLVGVDPRTWLGHIHDLLSRGAPGGSSSEAG